jgi:RNA recognition motif-containing protein
LPGALRPPKQEDVIATKVFVGNLNFRTMQDEIQSLFSEVGEVIEVFLPSDRMTGRPRGFAFVEFADEATATAAIQRFDGYELGGRNIRVNAAEAQRPRAPRGGGGGGGGGFFDGSPPPMRHPGGAKSKGSRRNLRARKRSLG